MKPERMQIRVESVPVELINHPAWVMWRWIKRDGRWTKPPFQINGKLAISTDPKTWTDFESAVNASKNGRFDGVGFMISKDSGYVGIDFDDCRCPRSGKIDTAALELIADLDSYTEVSPSGKGFKTLIKGKLPRRGHHSEKIGVFDDYRYFCITGAVLVEVSRAIEPRQKELNNLIRRFWPEDFGSKPEPAKLFGNIPKSDSEILERAFQSAHGRKIRALFNGDLSNYPSHSEADQALCNHLAFWFQKDPARMDAVFRSSGLMREKWEKRSDYRERTLQNGIDRCADVYRGGSKPQARSYPHQCEQPKNGSAIQGMRLNVMQKQFSQKIDWLWYRHIPAGMPSIINGREGLGKTTICLQIAKEILEANPGRSIIWFATEGTVADTYVKAIQLGLPDGPFQIAAKGGEDYLFNFKNYAERKMVDDFLARIEMPAAAVFIDSIRGMTSQSVNDEETGTTIRHLNSIVCDKHRASLVYLHHWSKRDTGSWLDRSTGSTSITAAVRLVLSVLPNSKLTRKLVVAKSNIADEIPTLNVVKQGDQIIFYDTEETESTMTDSAETFLTRLFNGKSEMLAMDIYRLGEADGHSKDALKRAKQNLGIGSQKNIEHRWLWIWPGKKV